VDRRFGRSTLVVLAVLVVLCVIGKWLVRGLFGLALAALAALLVVAAAIYAYDRLRERIGRGRRRPR
jgi:Na+/H+-translocating membrane pyrophosphatase